MFGNNDSPIANSKMLEFEIQRCTRHCASTSRAFEPGEMFYSVLVREEGVLVRRDYSIDSWEGPPEDVVGWWQSHMPEASSKGEQWAPDQILINYFEALLSDDEEADLCYVLALLFIRRKLFKQDKEASDVTMLQVHCPRNETDYEVPVSTPSDERIGEIQKQLSQMLFDQTDS